ncbi:MAG: YHS domain-containing (seleno)protein [Desulfoprunum sp.]
MSTSLNSTGRRLTIWLLACLLVAGLGGTAVGISAASDTAIKGYDPVAYFLAGKAMKGSEAHTYRWHNLTWHFQSGGNRDLFAATPEEFAPQYDGYCAWAMTEKRKAITDPEVWKIVDGKLYLNCSMAAYAKWSRDIPENIAKADANWLEFQQGK